ncbi:transporter [Spirochaetia bacterium]|nr:transporter [Spirochaetia bacterium]
MHYMKTFNEKLSGLPIAAVAAFMGAATLSNAWNSLGFPWIRNIIMCAAAVVWILFLCKILFAFKAVKSEYEKTVPMSLYGAFFMLLMILAMWLHTWIPGIAKPVFFVAVALHAIHILVFTFRNVLRGVKIETFLPCWFVTYNGIMVSTVVGFAHLPGFGNIILYYGIAVYAVVIVFMVIRLVRSQVAPQFLHTTPVVIAPVSLCLASYLNVEASPRIDVIIILYVLLLVSVLYVLKKLPRYFAVPFNPGFAGLTFPMAIGCVASLRTSAWLGGNYGAWGPMVRQIAGVQVWLTTAIIAFVLFNFLRMAARSMDAGTAS